MRSSEPYFNGDETRHVMTGVFVHDLIRDGAILQMRSYTERYYAQYPCLGLLVWPPGFYVVEGLAMFAFGPSHETGRGLVLVYLLVGMVFFFRIVERTHGLATAVIATSLLGISRQVFIDTRAVMLEVPTLACCLAAIDFFERYRISSRRRDLVAFVIATIAAGLHRYDAIFLAPLFAIRLAALGELHRLCTRAVLAAVAAIVLVLGPIYAIAYQTIGQQHALAMGGGSNPVVVKTGLEQITYYPESLEFQLGLIPVFAGILGCLRSLRREAWERSRLYWVMIVVVYGSFAVLNEQETRHTIYWLPAWCVFATETVLWPIRSYGRLKFSAVLLILVLGHGACWTLRQPVPWVRGYGRAAEYVLGHTEGTDVVLFDGHFDGTFIYGVRLRDVDRRIWIVRGDKIVYAMRSDPRNAYVEWKQSEAEILETLRELDPIFVVLEDPPLKFQLPAQTMLRTVVKQHPEEFELVATFAIDNNNIEWMNGGRLKVYRRLNRTVGQRRLNIPMLWGGRDLKVDMNVDLNRR